EFDSRDWDHFVMLVTPGKWRSQYEAWLPARAALLGQREMRRGRTLAQAIGDAAHQHLDDHESPYRRLELHLARGTQIRVEAHGPGEDGVGMEPVGDAVVVRRLGRPAAPELVMRAGSLQAGWLAG